MIGTRGISVLGCAAFLSWATAAFYSLKLNPEVLFFRDLSGIQEAWSYGLRATAKHQTILIGGSSALFSVMPERAWAKHGFPLANLGLAAGIGPQVMILRGLEHAKSGDTLLVGIEPALLTEGEEPSALGIQYAFAMKKARWICEPPLGIPRLSWGSALLALRPGGYHMVTLVGKILGRRPLFRYQISNVSRGGWVETGAREFEDNPTGHGPKLSAWSIKLLESMAARAAEKKIRLVYSLPWAYCPAWEIDKFQRANASFLLQIQEIMPVLFDPHIGAIRDKSLFADSGWHLNLRGSQLRTDELVAQLQNGRMWKRAELEGLAGGGQPGP